MEQVRRRCERWIDSLDIPEPFDVQALCAQVGNRLGRSIYLMTIAIPPGEACGLWLDMGSAYVLFVQERTSRLHQDAIALHELGHVLAANESDGSGASAGPPEGVNHQLLRRLVPDVDPTTIRRMLCRSVYTDPGEIEAEMFASWVMARASRRTWGPPRTWTPPTPEAHEIARRLTTTFEYHS